MSNNQSPVELSPVQDRLAALERTLSRIHDRIGDLETKMHSALLPVYEGPDTCSAVGKEEEISPLSAELRALNWRSVSAEQRLEDLIQRLTL